MHAISNAEAYQVIGFNRDGTQQRLCSARSLHHLLLTWSKELQRHEVAGKHNILPTFPRIRVWSIDNGWGFDLPYIETVVA